MHATEMQQLLSAVDLATMPNMYVISYNRAGSAPLLEMARKWPRPDKVRIVVRESQRVDYMLEYPEMQVHPLPDADIPGCGYARWGAMELARSLGDDRAIFLDDDVTHLRYLHHDVYTYRSKTPGAEKSGHARASEQHILAVAAQVAAEVYREHPHAVYGGLIKQHMSFDPRNHRTKYTLNGHVTPRQVMFWNLERAERHGVQLNLERFGITGEDLGFVGDVLARGLDCFALPSFTYDHWPEAVNMHRSTIRNAGNYREVLEYDLESIMQMELQHYVRIKRNRTTGEYEWADVNWVALHKHRGTKRHIEYWETLL